MQSPKSIFANHVFAGGYATDFGPVYRGGPDASGRVVLPFLTDARNCVYELDGGVRKMPGTARLNSTVVSGSSPIMGLYDFWRHGTGGSPSQYRVIHADTRILADNADGTFAAIGTGLVDGAIPHYATFDDLLIITSDATGDVPKSWDGTTFGNLAGSPPRGSFTCRHKNRMWMAGNFAAPSRLYYSVSLDSEDWVGATSGSIDIDPSDGDMITGIASFKNELWVFKGPYKGSIHRITGSSPSDFARVGFIEGLGAAWQTSLFTLPNDLGFMSPRGTVHSLVGTDRYGDYEQSSLSFPINRTLKSDLSHTHHRKWRAATDLPGGYVLLSVTPSGQTTNTKQLMMDFRFMNLGEPTPRWAVWDTFAAASLATVIDTGNRARIMAGSYTGYVWKLDQETRTHESGAITMNMETPFCTYGIEHIYKTIYAVGIEISPKNGNSFTFSWLRDGQAEQSETVTQGGSDVLGTWASNQFTLDTSTLGGSRYLQRFIELEQGGEFRAIRYGVMESTNNSDVEVHGIGAQIQIGGYSTENA